MNDTSWRVRFWGCIKLNSTGLDSKAYGLMLEELLKRLRQEIDSQLHIDSIQSVADLDQYILKINSFYYQGFLEYYLPRYEQRWQAEARELLMLTQQQQVLETNIVSTLKRYTRLHNLLKTLLANLKAFYQDTDHEVLLIQEETSRQGTELLFALTDLKHQLQSLQGYLTAVKPYLQDTELVRQVDEFPGYLEIFHLEGSTDLQPSIGSHKLSQALSEITYLMRLAGDAAAKDHDGRIRIAGDMQRHIDQLEGGVDSDDPVNLWISQKLTRELALYATALSAPTVSPDMQTLINKRLEGWHRVLKLRASNHCGPDPLIQNAVDCLGRISAENAQEALRDVEFSIQQLEQIIMILQNNPEPSYKVLVQVREWLAFWTPFLRSMSTEEEIRWIPPLYSLLYQVRVAISFLSNQLSMIETSRRRSAYNQDQAGRMRDLAVTQLEFLGQLKADLDRLLAPRNVSRTWKDMGVRLIKVPLQKGEVFPEEHIPLLGQARWEPRVDAARPDYTIVHEEGDLFIIQVLNEEQTEIPYMILTRQP